MGNPNATARGLFDPPMSARYRGHSKALTGGLAVIGFSGVLVFWLFMRRLNSPLTAAERRARKAERRKEAAAQRRAAVGAGKAKAIGVLHSVKDVAGTAAAAAGTAAASIKGISKRGLVATLGKRGGGSTGDGGSGGDVVGGGGGGESESGTTMPDQPNPMHTSNRELTHTRVRSDTELATQKAASQHI